MLYKGEQTEKYIGRTGKEYELGESAFSETRDGFLFDVTNDDTAVVKLYRGSIATSDRERALEKLIETPPHSVADMLAYPTDTIRDGNGNFVGYAMCRRPKPANEISLAEYYAAITAVGLGARVKTARDLAMLAAELHRFGHDMGCIDVDRITVDPSDGRVFVYGADKLDPAHGRASDDDFALAVHVTMLLTGKYPHTVSGMNDPSADCIDMFDGAGAACVFPNDVRELLKRSLNAATPPKASEWSKALDRLDGHIKTCDSGLHEYYSGLKHCPICGENREEKKSA